LALDVDAIRVAGRRVKHSYPGAAPLARRDPPADNRWQRGDAVDALYLAEDEQTAWAEWYRHLAERGLPPGEQVPRDLWEWEVDTELADLSDPARLARVGLGVPRPGRHGWPACQLVGETLAAEGWQGLIAPSAARPAHLVLCLFRAADGTVTGAAPLPPPRRVDQPPTPPTGMTT
jgi:RES domain-containing protein